MRLLEERLGVMKTGRGSKTRPERKEGRDARRRHVHGKVLETLGRPQELWLDELARKSV